MLLFPLILPFLVAPLAGAWIEMHCIRRAAALPAVAPLAGAWIEICSAFNCIGAFLVAPLAGAWIEIDFVRVLFQDIDRRSTRGSVD